MNIIKRLKPLLLGIFLYYSTPILAQTNRATPPSNLTLEQCVKYALQHRAEVEQALIDESIGDREIRSRLAGWFPQISANYGGTHNIKLLTQPIGDQLVTFGQKYTSNVLLEATQTIYSSSLLLASKASRFTKLQLDLNIQNTKINTVVEVSKAFYDVLFTQEQLRILDENVARQEKQYNDARSRYEVGLVDKTDHQRAAITLANIRSDRKRTQEAIKAKYAYLKQIMGYPIATDLQLTYEYERMQQEVLIDTAQIFDFANRIELQQLQAQRELLRLNTSYNKWDFMPVVTSYINYNWIYFNNEFQGLYNQAYPTSAVGIRASLPIFQGTRRIQNLKIAQLEEQRADIGIENTRKAINTEYQTALANYKSDFYEWQTLKTNMELAEEVYEVIKLQYDEGIKAYLDLIVAETDLRTAQLNYYNALYRVLSSKLDYQRALGNIDVNIY